MKFDAAHRAALRDGWKRRREEVAVGRYIRNFDRALFAHLLYASSSYSTRVIEAISAYLVDRGHKFRGRS